MKRILGCVTIVAALTACSADRLDKSTNYWQRSNTDSALYLVGPKAQHQLHKDIASCVNNLQELQRLGPLKDAIPPDTSRNQVPDYNPKNTSVATFDTPDRDGMLYAEYYDYVDFEGCMKEKGWQRAVALTPNQRMKGQDNWIRSLIDPNWGGGGAKVYGESVNRAAESQKQTLGYNN
jgi:hypothetical protein